MMKSDEKHIKNGNSHNFRMQMDAFRILINPQHEVSLSKIVNFFFHFVKAKLLIWSI